MMQALAEGAESSSLVGVPCCVLFDSTQTAEQQINAFIFKNQSSQELPGKTKLVLH